MIRYHPHIGGINQTTDPIFDVTRAEMLEMIQREERKVDPRRLVTSRDIHFTLIYDADEGFGRDASPAFKRFVNESGFKRVYSVMLDDRVSLGYSDDHWDGFYRSH